MAPDRPVSGPVVPDAVNNPDPVTPRPDATEGSDPDVPFAEIAPRDHEPFEREQRRARFVGVDRALAEIDPRRAIRAIAAGVYTAGLALLRPDSLKAFGASEETREVLTVDEAAEFLRVDRKTVYDAIGRGAIPHRRLGKRILLSRSGLVAWLGAWDKGSSDGGSI